MRPLLPTLLMVLLLAPAAGAAAPSALYDDRPHPLSDDLRTDLLFQGYRFEASTGHVLSPDTHKPLTVAQLDDLKRQLAADYRRDGLERIAALVDAENPAKPLDPGARLRAERIAEAEGVPPRLARDLRSARLLAGAVSAEADRDYLRSARVFDAQRPLSDFQARAVPLASPPPQPAPPPYFDASERALGRLLQQATQARLSLNPVGAELLAHFRDASGALRLPRMVVLPIESDAAATYAGGEIALSQKAVVSAIVRAAPSARRAALRAGLADSRALTRYLLAHPAALKAFLSRNDYTVAHELTHAWQSRRDPLFAEIDRGNFPYSDYVEQEQEAYLVEMRYVYEKLKANPAALDGDPDELDLYRRFAFDLDGWRGQIDQLYLEQDPQSAATLPTGEQMQAERVKAARRLSTLGSWWRRVESLKLLGLAQGSAEEEAYRARADGLLDRFRKTEYPAIQKDSPALLARAFLAAARADRGMARAEDLDDAARYADASADASLIAAVRSAKEKLR